MKVLILNSVRTTVLEDTPGIRRALKKLEDAASKVGITIVYEESDLCVEPTPALPVDPAA